MENRVPGFRETEARTTDQLTLLGDRACPNEIFLRRLKRALLLRFYTDSLLSPGDRQLLDRVIYSSYCDCLDGGTASEARRLLSEARDGVGLFRRSPSQVGGT